MNIDIRYGLPFVEVTICYRGKELHLEKVLLDTGSAGTIFNADAVDVVGVKVEPGDFMNKIRGVGGIEVVYSKLFDFIKVGVAVLPAFEVEIGDMNYGMEIDGILGFDFIHSAGLMIDAKELNVLAND